MKACAACCHLAKYHHGLGTTAAIVEGWLPVVDGDHRARALYLRHYSSRKRRRASRDPQFIGPGSKAVYLTLDCRAVFAWRLSQYRADRQVGVECTLFRNEGTARSSDLIEQACQLAWLRWPGQRLFTMVDPREVASPNPGYCFKRAGFRFCGRTSRGLHILERLP